VKFLNAIWTIGVIALGTASAASSYVVNFSMPTWVGGTELKAGDYQFALKDGKGVFKSGKNIIELPAETKVADTKRKYDSTSLTTTTDRLDGRLKLDEIDLGGIKIRGPV
jgi:hypothetical protein